MELIGAGLRSAADLATVAPTLDVGLQRLNLHMNCLTTTVGLGRFSKLEELVLSSNCIAEIRDLGSLRFLKVLDLSSNELQRLAGLRGLRSLQTLGLAYNRLETLEGLQDLWGPSCPLHTLDLRFNYIASLPQLLLLGGFPRLEEIHLASTTSEDMFVGGEAARAGRKPEWNLICGHPSYREALLLAGPALLSVDGRQVLTSERQRLKSMHEAPVSGRDVREPARDASAGVIATTSGHREAGDFVLGGLLERMEALVADLETVVPPPAASGPSVPRTALASLREEVLAEASALREAEEREELVAEKNQAERNRSESLREKLAALVPEVDRREAWLRECEDELAAEELNLAAFGDSFSAEELHCEIVGELNAEAAKGAALAAEAEDARRDASLCSEQVRLARAALKRLLDSSVRQVVDLPALRAEPSRAKALAEGLQYKTRVASEEVTTWRQDVFKFEQDALKEEAADDDEEARGLSSMLEARAMQSLATERFQEANLVAADAFRADERRESFRKQEEESLEITEAELVKLSQPGGIVAEEIALAANVVSAQEWLCAMEVDVDRQRRAIATSAEEALERRRALKMRLESALSDAEAHVKRGQADLDEAWQRLAQHRAIARLTVAHEKEGRFIEEELRLELTQSRCHEHVLMSNVEATSRRAEDRAENAAKFFFVARTLEAEAIEAQMCLAGPNFCQRSLVEGCLDACTVYRSSVAELGLQVTRGEERSEALRAEASLIESQRCRLELAVTTTHAREERSLLDLKIKQQMVVDQRHRIEDLQTNSRREMLRGQQVELACETKIERAKVAEQEFHKLMSLRSVAVDALRAEEISETRVAMVGAEHIDVGERELTSLRWALEQQSRRASARAGQLREEGLRVLAEADEAMADIDRRFRSARDEDLEKQRELQAELRTATALAAAAPGALRAAEQRVAQERQALSRRFAALLQGLRT